MHWRKLHLEIEKVFMFHIKLILSILSLGAAHILQEPHH